MNDAAKRMATHPVQAYSAQRLLECLANPLAASHEEITGQFNLLQRVIEAMPLMTEEFCFARNWVVSARDLWGEGDHAAASYQVGMVVKRLRL